MKLIRNYWLKKDEIYLKSEYCITKSLGCWKWIAELGLWIWNITNMLSDVLRLFRPILGSFLTDYEYSAWEQMRLKYQMKEIFVSWNALMSALIRDNYLASFWCSPWSDHKRGLKFPWRLERIVVRQCIFGVFLYFFTEIVSYKDDACTPFAQFFNAGGTKPEVQILTCARTVKSLSQGIDHVQ